MQFMLMIYGDERAEMAMTEAEREAQMGQYSAYTGELVEAGVIRGGEALMPTTTATTVRVRNGQSITTDGPFAETKEQLGGYYLIDCTNIEEAIGWAAKLPGASTGRVEVAPIMVFA